MKVLYAPVRGIVRKLRLEEFFVKLRKSAGYLRRFVPRGLRHRFGSFGKFVPQATSYPTDDSYLLTRDNIHFRINRSDYVQWRIFYGVRDNALMYAKKCLTPDSIVLDIGANCGAFSLKLAGHASSIGLSNLRIHAFEPNPHVRKYYEENLRLNPVIKEKIELHGVGLGNEKGTRSFYFSNMNTGAGRVVNDFSESQFEITIERLDDIIGRLNPSKIAFIKMIVEGFEPEVFKGGWSTFRKYRPPVFFEVTPSWYAENNSSLEVILRELRAMDYQFAGELYNELIPYEESIFAQSQQFNLLADVNLSLER